MSWHPVLKTQLGALIMHKHGTSWLRMALMRGAPEHLFGRMQMMRRLRST